MRQIIGNRFDQGLNFDEQTCGRCRWRGGRWRTDQIGNRLITHQAFKRHQRCAQRGQCGVFRCIKAVAFDLRLQRCNGLTQARQSIFEGTAQGIGQVNRWRFILRE